MLLYQVICYLLTFSHIGSMTVMYNHCNHGRHMFEIKVPLNICACNQVLNQVYGDQNDISDVRSTSKCPSIGHV